MTSSNILPSSRSMRANGLWRWLLGGTLLIILLVLLVAVLGPYYHFQRFKQEVARVNGSIESESSLPKWFQSAVRGSADWTLFQTSVVALNLNNAEIDDEWLSRIRQFPRIVLLELQATPITDAGLEHVGTLTRLRALDLNYTQVKGPGLVYLAKLNDLRQLALRECPVTDADLAALRGQNLEVALLDGTQITSAGLTRLGSELYNLRLADTAIDDAGLAHLRKCSKLRFLSLAHTRVTDAGLMQLEPLEIWWLSLAGSSITGSGFKHLPARISEIDLGGCPLTDEFLADMPNVEHLNLERTGITDDGIAALLESGASAGLERLSLSGTKVTDKGIALLASDGGVVTNLKWLAVAETAITSDGVRSLQTLARLEKVDPRATIAAQDDWNELSRLRSVNLEPLPPRSFFVYGLLMYR